VLYNIRYITWTFHASLCVVQCFRFQISDKLFIHVCVNLHVFFVEVYTMWEKTFRVYTAEQRYYSEHCNRSYIIISSKIRSFLFYFISSIRRNIVLTCVNYILYVNVFQDYVSPCLSTIPIRTTTAYNKTWVIYNYLSPSPAVGTTYIIRHHIHIV